MTGKSQAKTQCKTLKGYTRGISEKRWTGGDCFSTTSTNIHPCSQR